MFDQDQDDLCWVGEDGKHCDVVFSNVTGQWSALHDNQCIRDDFTYRNEAEYWLKTRYGVKL